MADQRFLSVFVIDGGSEAMIGFLFCVLDAATLTSKPDSVQV